MNIFELTTKYRRMAHCRKCYLYKRTTSWDFEECYGNGEKCLFGKMDKIVHDIQKEDKQNV